MTAKEFEIQTALGSLSYLTRRALAIDPNTPTEVLTILSKDKHWKVRYWVTTNPNTSPEVLDILSEDEVDSVRYWTAFRKGKLKGK